jgi:hypothetical protein
MPHTGVRVLCDPGLSSRVGTVTSLLKGVCSWQQDLFTILRHDSDDRCTTRHVYRCREPLLILSARARGSSGNPDTLAQWRIPRHRGECGARRPRTPTFVIGLSARQQPEVKGSLLLAKRTRSVLANRGLILPCSNAPRRARQNAVGPRYEQARDYSESPPPSSAYLFIPFASSHLPHLPPSYLQNTTRRYQDHHVVLLHLNHHARRC